MTRESEDAELVQAIADRIRSVTFGWTPEQITRDVLAARDDEMQARRTADTEEK